MSAVLNALDCISQAMLWVDKHRPATLARLDFHDELTDRLTRLAESAELPHLLFHGPPGCGKKTRITALLRQLFGSGVERLRLERRSFKTSSSKTVEVTTVASNHHIIINAGDAGLHDRLVVQEIVKEIAQGGLAATTGAARSFKVVVLTEMDRLSHDAQHALRRTMEKYTATCRLILCCHSPSKVIDPVRSRCLCVRVPAPSETEMVGVLKTVAQKESCPLPDALAVRVADASGGNLRRALLLLESTRMRHPDMPADAALEVPDWERFVNHVADLMTEEQTPARLLVVRGKLYELLINCIPADVVIKRLCEAVCRQVDAEIKPDIIRWAAFYEHRMRLGSKELFHLEAFVARVMAIYKQYMANLAALM